MAAPGRPAKQTVITEGQGGRKDGEEIGSGAGKGAQAGDDLGVIGHGPALLVRENDLPAGHDVEGPGRA